VPARNKLAISAVCAALALALGAGALVITLPEAAVAVPLDPSLASWYPLDVGQQAAVEANWGEGRFPLLLSRAFPRWESLGGESHLLLEWSFHKRGGLAPYGYEWLRPGVASDGTPELRCAQRQMGVTPFRLSPPQPILRAPLRSGQRWTWWGRVGDQRALSRFHVGAVYEHPERGPSIDVACVTVTGSDPALLDMAAATGGCSGVSMAVRADCHLASRVQTYAEGIGLIRETGVFPIEQMNQPVDHVEALLPLPSGE